VSVIVVFAWLAVVSLATACVIIGLAENNVTYILLGTFLAVVSAHFMVIITAAAATKLITKTIRKALHKEIEKLCREGESKWAEKGCAKPSNSRRRRPKRKATPHGGHSCGYSC